MEVFGDSKYKELGYKTKKQWQKEYKIIKSEKKVKIFKLKMSDLEMQYAT